MNLLTEIFPDHFATALAETIFHSVWQGFLILSLLWIVISMMSKKRSQLRYAAASISLLLMFLCSVFTFTYTYSSTTAPKEQPEFVNIGGKELQVINLDTYSSDESKRKTLATNIILESKHFINQYAFEISIIWLFGIIILSMRLLGGIFYLSRLKQNTVQNLPAEWINRINILKSKLGLNQTVSVLQSGKVKSPILIGFFKPVILLPIGIITGMPANHVEAVITHELAHIKRYDYLLNILQSLMEIIFFYHPAVWMISSVMREEREYCCDDIAIDVCKNSGLYARALILTPDFNNAVHASIPAVKNRKQLYRRIERMLGEEKSVAKIKNKFTASLMTLLFISTFVLYACASADEHTVIKVKDDGNVVKISKKVDDVKKSDRPRIIVKHNDDVLNTGDFDEPDEIVIHLDDDFDIDIDDMEIDLSEFEHNMERLSAKLDKLDFHFNFDQDEFQKKMEKLGEGLENLHFHFDSDKFNESMEKLHDNLANIDIDIDFDLDLDLEELEYNLAKIDFSELEEKLERLEDFVDELRSELYKDGYINHPKEEFDLDLGSDEMWLNNERMPEDVHQKYLDLYEDFWGKKMKKNNRFQIN